MSDVGQVEVYRDTKQSAVRRVLTTVDRMFQKVHDLYPPTRADLYFSIGVVGGEMGPDVPKWLSDAKQFFPGLEHERVSQWLNEIGEIKSQETTSGFQIRRRMYQDIHGHAIVVDFWVASRPDSLQMDKERFELQVLKCLTECAGELIIFDINDRSSYEKAQETMKIIHELRRESKQPGGSRGMSALVGFVPEYDHQRGSMDLRNPVESPTENEEPKTAVNEGPPMGLVRRMSSVIGFKPIQRKKTAANLVLPSIAIQEDRLISREEAVQYAKQYNGFYAECGYIYHGSSCSITSTHTPIYLLLEKIVGQLPEKPILLEDPSILISHQIHPAPHFFGSLSNLSTKSNNFKESKAQKSRLVKSRSDKEVDPVDKYMDLWKSKRSLKEFGVDKVTWLN